MSGLFCFTGMVEPKKHAVHSSFILLNGDVMSCHEIYTSRKMVFRQFSILKISFLKFKEDSCPFKINYEWVSKNMLYALMLMEISMSHLY